MASSMSFQPLADDCTTIIMASCPPDRRRKSKKLQSACGRGHSGPWYEVSNYRVRLRL